MKTAKVLLQCAAYLKPLLCLLSLKSFTVKGRETPSKKTPHHILCIEEKPLQKVKEIQICAILMGHMQACLYDISQKANTLTLKGFLFYIQVPRTSSITAYLTANERVMTSTLRLQRADFQRCKKFQTVTSPV